MTTHPLALYYIVMVGRRKASTTKDTKEHDGLHVRGFSSCDFVSFVVKKVCQFSTGKA